MFKIKFLRNILLICLGITILFPLYDIFVAYPTLLEVITSETEDEAIRTARHLSTTLFPDKLKTDSDLTLAKKRVLETIKEDFKLFKLKLFSPSGKVIYSTVPSDIGMRSPHSYFYDIVTKGKPHSIMKKKETVSPDGKKVMIDVVAAYIPLMDNGRFTGAFEIYYDVTARKKNVTDLITRSSIFLVVLSCVFFAMVYMALLRAKENILHRLKVEEELKNHRDDLENAVKERTADLRETNVKLESEIRDRIEAKKQIMEAKKDWESTFDTISDMITIVDNDYDIIQANKAAREESALSNPDEGDGKCFGYYPGMKSPAGGPPNVASLEEGESRSVELFEPHLNRFLEIRTMPRRTGGSNLDGMIHIVRDITERKSAQESIQHQVKRLSVLHSIEKATTSIFDLNVVLEILVEQVTTKLGIDAANVLLYKEQSQVLEFVVSKGFQSNALKFTRLRLGEGNAGIAALKRVVLMVPDLKKEPGGFGRSECFDNENFVSYYGIPLVARGKIKGVLELFSRSSLNPQYDFEELLETIGNQAAVAIDNATLFEDLERSNIEITQAYDKTIEGWSKAMDMRDHETEGHSRRVSEMTYRIALDMGLPEEKLVHIRRGALLHDMGKMAIPDSILLKPGKLTDDEWEIMRRHPEFGYQMLSEIEFLRDALDIPFYHHEKWDGTGYPKGLKGEDIPVPARIFAVVDVWDALSSNRPYRPAWPMEKVYEEIRSQSGRHFDPKVVEVFLQLEKLVRS